MMDKVDLRLLMTQQALAENRLPEEAFESAGVVTGPGAARDLRVIVQFTGQIAPLEAAGLRVESRFDDIVTGLIAPAKLGALAAVEGVQRIQGDAPLPEELNLSVTDVQGDKVNRAPGVGTPPAPYTGKGVIVATIDSGIDFKHESFLKADGTTRVLAIWDQTLVATGTEAAPQGRTQGVEYARAALNAELSGASPVGTIRHKDPGGHGTHVASIAAGGGAAFPGMAPDADIVAVRADSILNTVNAIKYILDMAQGLGRPVVINQSQGILAGPHDGTHLSEIAIDRAIGAPGHAYVVAAGNHADEQTYSGAVSVPAGGSATLRLSITSSAASPLWSGSVELWYRTGDLLSVSLATPAGVSHGPHAQPAAGVQNTAAVTAGGTNLAFGRQTDVPANHYNQVAITLVNGGAAGIEGGAWTITLTNAGTRSVEVHAWAERSNGNVGFAGVPATGQPTSISMPGSAREAIAVGCYVTRVSSSGTPLQQISSFSGRGPTLDGRIKPDITAPGEIIVAALSRDSTSPPFAGAGGGKYTAKAGTSMATPHVAGAIACLFEKRPALTQEQVRNGLARTARADAQTGPATGLPNNTWGRGKLDAKALLEYAFPTAETRTWARVRSSLYNWTEGDTPPTFEVTANENGRAVIELAWGSGDIPTPPALDPAAPLRYYNTGARFTVNVTKADGSSVALDIPEQAIVLRDNHAEWKMPQPLWDAYREELKKAHKTPPASQMRQMLYYRVRFEPTGAASAVVWPDDSSFNASPLNNRMGIIALNMNPITQVAPDQPAIQAMPRFASELEWMWKNLPLDNPDRQSLATLFSHRFFTNSVETEIRGKILSLWVLAGPARQRVHTMLDRMFRSSTGTETTVFKQRCVRDNIMLIDHLLELVKIVPHPDMSGVRVAEQLADDVLREIMDPNGQVNQGQASTCAPTGVQTLLLNTNAAEYARLMRGWLSASGQATLANEDVVAPPAGIFRAALYAGAQSSGFFVRTYSELAFQASILKYALGDAFPGYDPDAPPNDTRGINTVFQATIRRGMSFDQIKRVLDALFKRNYAKTIEAAPSATLRSGLLAKLQSQRDPILTVLHWNAPATAANTGLHAVVALRAEGGRVFFKNPQYAGSGAPASMVPNSSVLNPPRRLDDPTQALESMGDNDLTGWVRGYYAPA